MSELITQEIFTDGQENINASNMNGIVGRAKVQPDIIASKPVSAAMDVADQFLVLKTDNTLARGRFDAITNSVASQLPIADSTKNGMLRQTSGKTTDFLDGTNSYQPITNIIPPGVVWDYAGPVTSGAPTGWLKADGASYPTATYPALFAVIGYTYGGSGANFSVPNFNGRMAAGPGGNFGALGATGGATAVTLATTHLPNHVHPITDQSHTHTVTDNGHAHTYVTIGAGGAIAAGSGYTTVGGAGTSTGFAALSCDFRGTGINTTLGVTGAASTAFSIANPFIVVNRIIKT